VSAVLDQRGAEWAAFYAAGAAVYRAQAELFRREAERALLSPLHRPEYRRQVAADYLARADEAEQMAREHMEGEA
jgi:hypothetical protein